MGMESGGLSASDVALLDGNGMNGGNSFMWIFGLLILMSMFNGGFGNNNFQNAIGYENLATSNEIQRGFDNQNLQAQTRDILSAVTNGTAQTVAATNNTFHDMLGALGDKYAELQRDISNVQLGQAQALANQNQCCCETKQMIMQNNYDGAMRDAQTNANFTAQIQSVKDMIAQNKIEALQNEVNGLRLAQATSNVVRYPVSTTYAVPSPCFNGCGCNNI